MTALLPADTTKLTIALDALGRARAEAVLPKVREGLRQYRRDTLGERVADVGEVGVGYVLHGAMGVGLNRWRLRPEDLPDAETFQPHVGDRVELVEVDVADADLSDACLLASELSVEVSAVLSAALATGLAKLAGDLATCGPFLLPAAHASPASES